ncbi:hypothetical protein BDW68DRAFT_158949 [Aspergillus falconensis]
MIHLCTAPTNLVMDRMGGPPCLDPLICIPPLDSGFQASPGVPESPCRTHSLNFSEVVEGRACKRLVRFERRLFEQQQPVLHLADPELSTPYPSPGLIASDIHKALRVSNEDKRPFPALFVWHRLQMQNQANEVTPKAKGTFSASVGERCPPGKSRVLLSLPLGAQR